MTDDPRAAFNAALAYAEERRAAADEAESTDGVEAAADVRAEANDAAAQAESLRAAADDQTYETSE